MTQPEPNHTRSAIIADLACLVGEVAQIQADQAQLAERQSALQGRLGKMIRDLSTTTATMRPLSEDDRRRLQASIAKSPPAILERSERPAPAAQAAVVSGFYENETPEMAVRLKEALSYDPSTGLLRWRITASSKAPAGSVAGNDNGDGYIRTALDGQRFMAHRVCWLLHYGEWPANEIEHENDVGSDNRIKNLKAGDRYSVNQNQDVRPDNKSGCPGVDFRPQDSLIRPWRARITRFGERRQIGTYATLDEAIEARRAAEQQNPSPLTDTAPAADEKKTVNDQQAKALEGAMKPDPLVSRRPAQVVPGNGRVQDGGEITRGDQVLDLWAATVLNHDGVAEQLKTTPNTVSVYLAKARKVGDPRAKKGDEARFAVRYDQSMNEYASTDLSVGQIDHKLGFAGGTTQRCVTKAWGDGDQRVKDGDARRRPAAAVRADKIAGDPPPIPDGALILVDEKHGQIVGPGGTWPCAPFVAKALRILADGNLYGIDRLATAAAIKPLAIVHAIPLWQSSLRRIGINLVHTPHIGCKLNRIAA